VVDIVDEGRATGRQVWQVLLDRTEFRVGDSGVLEAVARSGAKLTVQVLGVVERADELWHQVEKPLLQETEVTGIVTTQTAQRR
jgi:alanyl-tRNA synthetase